MDSMSAKSTGAKSADHKSADQQSANGTGRHPGSKSVGWTLVQAARLHRTRIGDRLADLGLFAGQEQVLQALAAQGAMTMGALASMLRVRPPTASKTVSRLAAIGLVERKVEPGDARVVRVGLTTQGVEKARAIELVWDAVERELVAGLDQKERKRLRKLLRKIARNLAATTGADEGGLDGRDGDFDDVEDADEATAAPRGESPRAVEPA